MSGCGCGHEDPIDILRAEHDHIWRGLAVLDAIAEKELGGGGASPSERAEILEFIRVFADGCHHMKEEDVLFPALVAAGLPSKHGPIAVMLAEHDMGRDLVRRMADAVERGGVDFAHPAQTFIRQLRSHILKENNILFPVAGNLLGHDQKQAALAEYTRHREKMGTGIEERLLKSLDRLVSVWGTRGPAMADMEACGMGGRQR